MISSLRKMYQKIHGLLPDALAEKATDVVSVILKRPVVFHDPEKHPRIGLGRGAVTFSIDFEMAWAFQYSKSSRLRCKELAMRERNHVPEILRVFEECAVPATWATVGHLCLEGCKRTPDGVAHPEIPRMPYFENRYWGFSSGDWFQYDPCTDVRTDPAWYAPDLVECIITSRANHELASHGFSHVGFGSYCPPEVAEAELEACIEAMRPLGVRPTTLVFPGNDVGNLDVVASKGFSAVRAFPTQAAEISLPLKINSNLWGIHTSLAVDKGTEAVDLRRRLATFKIYVERAMASKLAAHFWFHPSLSRTRMHGLLFPLIRYCAQLRDEGKLDIFTMQNLVRETELAVQINA